MTAQESQLVARRVGWASAVSAVVGKTPQEPKDKSLSGEEGGHAVLGARLLEGQGGLHSKCRVGAVRKAWLHLVLIGTEPGAGLASGRRG